MSDIKIDIPDITVIVDKGEVYSVNIVQPDTVAITTGSTFLKFADIATSASYALTASYALNAPTIPSGTISSSAQVSYPELQNIPEGIVSSSAQAVDWTVASASVATSSSYAATASYALNTIDLPDGLISESSQVILQDTTGNLSASRIDGTVASALTASFALNVPPLPDGLISSSTQVNYPNLQNIPTGIVSSSTQATTWTVASASVATTASYAVQAGNADTLDGLDSTVFATTGSNTFIGNQTVTGSIFTDADTLILTGSLLINGTMEISETITGSIINAISASHIDGGVY